MSKREAVYKSTLMKHVRRAFPVPEWITFRHEDRWTSGIPDISITGNRATSWWEVKHGDPKIVSKEIQDLTCKRLEAAGHACYHIIFRDDGDGEDKITLIVRPRYLESLTAEVTADGFNYAAILDFMRSMHS